MGGEWAWEGGRQSVCFVRSTVQEGIHVLVFNLLRRFNNMLLGVVPRFVALATFDAFIKEKGHLVKERVPLVGACFVSL